MKQGEQQQQPLQPSGAGNAKAGGGTNPVTPQKPSANAAAASSQQVGNQTVKANKGGEADKSKRKPYLPDYRRRRMNKMKEIERFLLEEDVKEHVDLGFGTDVNYLDELDYHLGDFVFQLKNPDHPEFTYEKNKGINLSKINIFDNKTEQEKIPMIKFSELSIMADLVLHSDTPFEAIRAENHLINLALFRAFKRINDYTKIRDDPSGQEDYIAAKQKFAGEPNEKMFMIKYTTEQLAVFEAVPKPPKDRKKNRQYKKSNMIVDDEGYANTLKNDIRIPVASLSGYSVNGEKIDSRKPYLVKDTATNRWKRTENPITDFTTLFRNYLIYKLTAQGGFKVRQVLSQDGKYIFVVLYISFENLKVQASLMGLSKTFEMTQTDLLSLEPVDRKLRPLRLNHQLKLLTPELKSGAPEDKAKAAKKEREEREKVKNDLFFAKYTEKLSWEMQKFEGHRLVSDEDYLNIIDPNVDDIELSLAPINKIIMKQKKLKYVDQVEKAKKSLTAKSKYLAQLITAEKKQIRKNIGKELDAIPMLQHSALARKYINSTYVSNFTEHEKLFPIKLEIVKVLFSINFKEISHECNFSYLPSTEEIQDNSLETIAKYEAYLSYLKILEQKISKIREKYVSDQEWLIPDAELKSILTQKRDVSAKTLEQRAKKTEKCFVQKQVKITENSETFDVYIPAQNWWMRRARKFQLEVQDAFVEALLEAKKKHGHLIQTIWDYYEIPFQQVFSDFTYVSSTKKTSNKILLENSWQRTPININERYEIFNKMERIKVTTAVLVSLLDFSKLKSQEDLIFEFFPLHDKFQLFGEKEHSDIFRRIIEHKVSSDHPNDQNMLELSRKAYDTGLKDKKLIENLCLMPNWSSILPFLIPENEICDYFGEKITMYFVFLSFYFKKQFIVSIVSTAVFVVQELYTNEDDTIPQIALLVHIIIIVCWANAFCGQWNIREIQFALKYGQAESEGEDDDIRPGFQGEYERSITSNKLNEYSYDKRKTYSTERWTWLGIIVMLIGNIVVIYALIYLGVYFNTNSIIESTGESFIELNVAVPAFMLEVIFVVEEYFFKKYALYTCTKANFKTNNEFEQSYATKVFAFIFFNHFIPPTLISFIIELNIGCVDGSCGHHLQSYVRAYQYIVLIKNFVEVFYPILLFSVQKVNKLVGMVISKDQAQDEEYNFYKINAEIEQQAQLSCSVVDGIDLPTRDYIEIFSYFCFNVTYGVAFPLVFIITQILTLIKIAVSRSIYSSRIQRPSPQNASTIGIFNTFMNIGSSLSILTYTGVFCFTRTTPTWPFSQLTAFMALIFFFFLVKFLIGRYYQDVDTKTSDLLKRQNFILESFMLKNLAGSTTAKIRDAVPFFKIYGTNLEDKTSLLKKNS